jgi:hypothetical protein
MVKVVLDGFPDGYGRSATAPMTPEQRFREAADADMSGEVKAVEFVPFPSEVPKQPKMGWLLSLKIKAQSLRSK